MKTEYKSVGFMYGDHADGTIQHYLKDGWAVFSTTSMYSSDGKHFLGGSGGAQYYVTFIRSVSKKYKPSFITEGEREI